MFIIAILFLNATLMENKMNHDWQELTKLTQGEKFLVERIRLVEKNIAIEGSFELPPLLRLTLEDQMFVMAFIRCHGSIKEMETLYGVSYPTIKSRLLRIAQGMELVEINPPLDANEILSKLEKGEITVEEAEDLLRR